MVILLAPLSVTYSENITGRVLIPPESFRMGCSQDDPDCGKDEGPAGGTAVEVPAFEIDQFEVSVADYRTCVKAGHCAQPKDYYRSKYCNYDAPGREDHPMNCIDWDQALAYCEWAGGRLPYEAEWEKAARGQTTSRYPWGQDVTCLQAILDDGVTLGSAGDEPDGCGEDRTWPRGQRPANAYGLFDMHGNAGEWTMNWYAENSITTLYAKGDIKGPDAGQRKVVRGGSWDENKSNLRSSYRNVKPPISGKAVYGSIGFRCAYNVTNKPN